MDQSELTYPIAETFCSPQGEGQWQGTLMHFIRFAGCTVGKPYSSEERNRLSAILHPQNKLVPIRAGTHIPAPSAADSFTPSSSTSYTRHPINDYQERCCTQMGSEFTCDTNFRMSRKRSIQELIDDIGDTPRVCLTGGEPLMHNLTPLLMNLSMRHKQIHLETSGTILFAPPVKTFTCWIAVSPKKECLQNSLAWANEIKVLVDPKDFNEDLFTSLYAKYIREGKVWIQPINFEHEIDFNSLRRCLALQQKFPTLRISTQMHKIWGVR